MTIKIYTFSTRRHDLSPQQYKDYYETKHAPLILSLLSDAAPLAYVRNYISRSPDGSVQLLMGQEEDIDFDCVCESTFRDQAHMEQCISELNRPGKKEQREADEAKFLDLGKLKVVMIETHGDYR